MEFCACGTEDDGCYFTYFPDRSSENDAFRWSMTPNFIDTKKSHVGITTEFASAPFDALGLEIFEDRRGGAEQHRVSGEHGRMAYVFGDQGFAQAVSADQHQIACLLQEVQGEGAFNDIAIDLGWPVPLEVGQGFETFDG